MSSIATYCSPQSRRKQRVTGRGRLAFYVTTRGILWHVVRQAGQDPISVGGADRWEAAEACASSAPVDNRGVRYSLSPSRELLVPSSYAVPCLYLWASISL